MRGAATALLLASVLAFGARAQEAGPIVDLPPIVIGVRVDTPPFAWQDANGGYLGFLVDLCFAAVARTDYPLGRPVPVDAARRREILRGEGEQVDVLCDPTTMTLARIDELRAHTDMEFSPIVFVANGSYVVQPDAAKGRLAGTDAANCLPQPAAPSETAEPAPDPVWLAAGFVLGTTGEQVVRDAMRAEALKLKPGEAVCPVEMPTHWDAAKAFCAGELHYYFGDQDILRSVLADDGAGTGRLPEGAGCVAAQLRALRAGALEPARGVPPGFRHGALRASPSRPRRGAFCAQLRGSRHVAVPADTVPN